MAWVFKVYDPDNDTEQGTIAQAYRATTSYRLGDGGVISFGIDLASSDDIDLLDYRRVVRVYEDSEAADPFAAGFVDDDPTELVTSDEIPKTTVECPSLDAWLGTSDLGGAVVYPFGGLSGRQQDPRRFGPEALEFDDTAWTSPSTDGSTPSSFAGGEPSWFVSTNRSLFRLVIPSGSGSFPGRMLLRASRKLNVEVYLDADRMLSKSEGQTGVTQFDVDYDDSEDRVVLIDVAGSGKVGWAWGEVVEDEDDDSGALDSIHFVSDDDFAQLDDYSSYPGMTPGYIAKTLVDEAKARGALAGLTYDFDEDVDSDGTAWTGTVAHAFAVGSKLGWVLEQITQFGYDWRVSPDGVLQIYELLGDDRSATVDLDVLEEHRAAGEGIKATALLWLSAGSMSETDVASAVGRIEEAATFGTSASAVKLEAVAESLLDDLSVPRDTSTLALSGESPQPYTDFFLGDVVAYTDRDGSSTGRVTEIVGTQDDADGTVSWSVTVDFETGQYSRERERRVRDQLREAFAQTVGGRALLAAPRDGRGDGGGTNVPDGLGAADPRTITVEASDVTVPADGVTVPWERLTSPRHQVEFDAPSFPDTDLVIPSYAVWQPRVETEWSSDEFGVTSRFLGGGDVELRLNGWAVWPLGDGRTSPRVAGPARAFEATLPALELAEDDRISLSVDHGDTRPRLLSRSLLTLSLLEPLTGTPPSYDDQVETAGTTGCGGDCRTTGPQIWVRYKGSDNIEHMGDTGQPGDGGLCFNSMSASESLSTDPDGPFGNAGYRIEDGTSLEQGTGSCPRANVQRTMAMWFRYPATPDNTGVSWLFGHRQSTGSGATEANGPIFIREGGDSNLDTVTFRLDRQNFKIEGVDDSWHLIVATVEGSFPDDGHVKVWLDNVKRWDTPIVWENSEGPSGGNTLSAWAGRDATGESSWRADEVAIAEVASWRDALTETEVGDIFASGIHLVPSG